MKDLPLFVCSVFEAPNAYLSSASLRLNKLYVWDKSMIGSRDLGAFRYPGQRMTALHSPSLHARLARLPLHAGMMLLCGKSWYLR